RGLHLLQLSRLGARACPGGAASLSKGRRPIHEQRIRAPILAAPKPKLLLLEATCADGESSAPTTWCPSSRTSPRTNGADEMRTSRPPHPHRPRPHPRHHPPRHRRDHHPPRHHPPRNR